MNRLFSRILLLAIFLTAFASCRRIPLYDPEADVYLKLLIKLNTDVQLNEDLDIDSSPTLQEKVYGSMPERVRACFYDINSHKMVHETFLPAEGGFVNIPAGTYDLIVYSLGTRTTQVKDEDSRAAGYAYTNSANTKVRFASRVGTGEEGEQGESIIEQTVIYEPDHIFVGRREGIVVPVRADIDKTVVIECEMESLVESYSFEVRNVIGIDRIDKAEVYITGQAPLRYLWDARRPNRPAAIYFVASLNEKKGHIYTVFNTFGKYPGLSNYVFLNVRVKDTSGNLYQWEFDVTDQFDNPDNVHHEIIIDETVEIPEAGSSAGGFSPSVRDWEIINIPITVE